MTTDQKLLNKETWAVGLARFLQQNNAVEALRVDSESQKVSIATLGIVDMQALQANLT